MNLEAQKTGNMKSSLSEEKFSRHEKTLKKERDFSSKRELEPMAQVELNNQNLIFQNNRFKSSSDLLAKYKLFKTLPSSIISRMPLKSVSNR